MFPQNLVKGQQDQLVQVQHIRENNVTWKEFKKHFEKKYLTKRYYYKNMKDFFELKLGNMTIDEYERIFCVNRWHFCQYNVFTMGL